MRMIFAAIEALDRARFGQGSGEILLDNVRCTGSESRLIDCPANALGDNNCAHSEDAGVRCLGNNNYSYSVIVYIPVLQGYRNLVSK